MKTSEALLAIIRCMGITDELDDVLKKTAEQILIKVNEDISKAEEAETAKPEGTKPAKRRGRPRKTEVTNEGTIQRTE